MSWENQIRLKFLEIAQILKKRRVSVKHNEKKGMIAIDQIRTVDKIRIMRLFETLTKSEIEKCKAVIKETFVD